MLLQHWEDGEEQALAALEEHVTDENSRPSSGWKYGNARRVEAELVCYSSMYLLDSITEGI